MGEFERDGHYPKAHDRQGNNRHRSQQHNHSEISDGIKSRHPEQERCDGLTCDRGTHKTKGRSEIWRTGMKMYAQKGTGGARHGPASVPQFRGGGRAFGPVVRSHAIDLPNPTPGDRYC